MTNTKPCKYCLKPIPMRPWSLTYCGYVCRLRDMAKDYRDIDGCWEWPNSRNTVSGYGQLSVTVNGKQRVMTAHRASYSALVDENINGKHICHRCDNPPCWNPAHLFAGSMADNMQDMKRKGRHWRQRYGTVALPRGDDHWSRREPWKLKRGEENNKTPLTADQVREIRKSTETLAKLSEKYGVTQSSLSSIRLRKTWKHVD